LIDRSAEYRERVEELSFSRIHELQENEYPTTLRDYKPLKRYEKSSSSIAKFATIQSETDLSVITDPSVPKILSPRSQVRTKLANAK
jgi:hypothetical protein